MGKGRVLLNTRSLSHDVAMPAKEVLTESALKIVYPYSGGLGLIQFCPLVDYDLTEKNKPIEFIV